MIKAITTTYNGYKFRSRLEARWAVFFDEIGADYEYEPEGFDLNGIKYLPDFWVDGWASFVEIKPVAMTDEEVEKCRLLSELSENRVIAIQGQPWIRKYFLSVFEQNGLVEHSTKCEFGKCRKCECLHIVSKDDELDLYASSLETKCCDTEQFPLGETWSHRLDKGFRAARAARFEFGQTPRK